MLEKHKKFKAYWESIGKPKLEMFTLSEKWENVNFNLDFSGADYRIKDDPHWELRREWIDSDFTLPIEYLSKVFDGWTKTSLNTPGWGTHIQYRKAQTNKEHTMTEQSSHAALIDEYCKDWKANSSPWKDWQYQAPHWKGGSWDDCSGHPGFDPDYKYRRKPKTININGFDVPMPISVKPEIGQTFYWINLEYVNFYESTQWNGSPPDIIVFERNICHLDANSVIIHAKALLSFTGKQNG